jgi:hypothetical protein
MSWASAERNYKYQIDARIYGDRITLQHKRESVETPQKPSYAGTQPINIEIPVIAE